MKLNVALTVAGVAALDAAVHAALITTRSGKNVIANAAYVEHRSNVHGGTFTLAARNPGIGFCKSVDAASTLKTGVEDILTSGTEMTEVTEMGHVRSRSPGY